MIACTSEWADALGVVGVAWAAVAAYAIWRLTGGKHEREIEDR